MDISVSRIGGPEITKRQSRLATDDGTGQRRRGRGQSLVEFTLVLPVLTLVLSGILDFGFLLYSRMTVINAAREGARAAVTMPDPTTIPTVVRGTVESLATGLDTTRMTVTVTCVAIATSPGPCSWATQTSSKPGDGVSVTATYQYSSFFPLLFGKNIPFSTTVQMVLE